MACNFGLKSYLWFQIEFALVRFWKHAYDFRPNCTPLSSITIIYSEARECLCFSRCLATLGLPRMPEVFNFSSFLIVCGDAATKTVCTGYFILGFPRKRPLDPGYSWLCPLTAKCRPAPRNMLPCARRKLPCPGYKTINRHVKKGWIPSVYSQSGTESTSSRPEL